ncbi:hypothetical protein J2X36_002716 [Methylobacterium sp. BE186]|uniref:hypothetical protein n=1 Tax=Methylobacterium sp. BE186 TaxID=2817715 RepID=UPI00285B5880|nr:hypothetical protein [Methylobacterium sp. BE186]MDR7037961.1 hypothetical protein [Methylobacterium sp. BE186]
MMAKAAARSAQQAQPRTDVRATLTERGRTKVWALLLAGLTGLGTGLGAALYTDLKTRVGTWFYDKPAQLYIKELNGTCGANQQPNLADTDVFPHTLSASRVGGTWSGAIVENGHKHNKYTVTGYKSGNYLNLSFVSASGNAGIGSISMYRKSGSSDDVYEGFFTGKDCSAGTEQIISCPAVLTNSTDIVAVKQSNFMKQGCFKRPM